jgi:hypothetical protein
MKELVKQSVKMSGVPEKVTDPVVLAFVAAAMSSKQSQWRQDRTVQDPYKWVA